MDNTTWIIDIQSYIPLTFKTVYNIPQTYCSIKVVILLTQVIVGYPGFLCHSFPFNGCIPNFESVIIVGSTIFSGTC